MANDVVTAIKELAVALNGLGPVADISGDDVAAVIIAAIASALVAALEARVASLETPTE